MKQWHKNRGIDRKTIKCEFCKEFFIPPKKIVNIVP